MSEPNSSPPPEGQFLVYQAEDGKLKLEVRFEGETVWLTQQHMAELFQTTKQNIGQHLKSIFAEGELLQNSVVKDSFTTAADGKNYATRFYNLDAIIAVVSAPSFRLQGRGRSPSGPKIQAQRAVSSNPKSVPLFTSHSPPATRNCITPEPRSAKADASRRNRKARRWIPQAPTPKPRRKKK